MKWEIFTDLYCSNFGRLTEADGLREWAAFVTNEVRDEQILRTALQPYIDRFAAALDNMEPVPRKPTLGQIRRAYFTECARRKRNREEQIYGARPRCPLCRGIRWVFVLSPMGNLDDRSDWPADFRTADWEDYRGVELAPCPNCVGDKEHPYPLMSARDRIAANCVAMTVREGDQNYPDWEEGNLPSELSGDQVITSWMRRNWMRRNAFRREEKEMMNG